MGIEKNNRGKKKDIADKFNERVRDWVSTNTQWVAGTGVWDTNVGTVVANSISNGGGVNRQVAPIIDPQLADANAILDRVSAAGTNAGSIVQVLRDLSSLYVNTHKIQLTNTGNVGDAYYIGTAELDGAPQSYIDQVHSEINNAAVSNGVVTGGKLAADTLLNFIEACRTIWANRCNNGVIEEFKYGYCHSSCHTNYTCYNSRGRR